MVSIATLGMFAPVGEKQVTSGGGGIIKREDCVSKRLNIKVKKIVSRKFKSRKELVIFCKCS